jgi:hypothetical protein
LGTAVGPQMVRKRLSRSRDGLPIGLKNRCFGLGFGGLRSSNLP